MKEEYSSIVFLNAQSICAKFVALENDWNVRGSLIFGVADTRFEPSRERKMAGFDAPECFSSSDDHLSTGIAVYNKIPYSHYEAKQFYRGNEIKASLVVMKYQNFLIDGSGGDILISFVYILPNANDVI